MHANSPLDCEIDNPSLTCPHCGWTAPRQGLHRNCPVRMKAYFRWHWGDLLARIVRRWTPLAIYEAWGFAECGTCSGRRLWLNALGTSCERRAARLMERIRRRLKAFGRWGW